MHTLIRGPAYVPVLSVLLNFEVGPGSQEFWQGSFRKMTKWRKKWIDILWYTYIFTWYLAGWRNLQRSWQPWQYCWWDIWPRYSVPVWGSCTGYFQFLFHVHIYLRFLGAWHLKRIVSDVNKDCWSLPIVNCFLYRQYLHNRFTLLTSPRCYSVFAERAWII